ncbi:hypothetical protein BDZ94DRAFT_1331016 [Collybia nuda]|uniref:Uncharacterized protein n=1 Tax=Collybia nuda TaxID=64659 RepID=A0A9P5XWA7_9AGAR|nr:hypothetical protein BDZ94DRAFT_1331016 [Collybia nuda]
MPPAITPLAMTSLLIKYLIQVIPEVIVLTIKLHFQAEKTRIHNTNIVLPDDENLTQEISEWRFMKSRYIGSPEQLPSETSIPEPDSPTSWAYQELQQARDESLQSYISQSAISNGILQASLDEYMPRSSNSGTSASHAGPSSSCSDDPFPGLLMAEPYFPPPLSTSHNIHHPPQTILQFSAENSMASMFSNYQAGPLLSELNPHVTLPMITQPTIPPTSGQAYTDSFPLSGNIASSSGSVISNDYANELFTESFQDLDWAAFLPGSQGTGIESDVNNSSSAFLETLFDIIGDDADQDTRVASNILSNIGAARTERQTTSGCNATQNQRQRARVRMAPSFLQILEEWGNGSICDEKTELHSIQNWSSFKSLYPMMTLIQYQEPKLLDYVLKTTRQLVFSTLAEVAEIYNFIPNDRYAPEHINLLLSGYHFLWDNETHSGFFQSRYLREGLVRYIYFAQSGSQQPIGIDFPEAFGDGIPLWLLANFGATVSHPS